MIIPDKLSHFFKVFPACHSGSAVLPLRRCAVKPLYRYTKIPLNN